LSFEDPKTTILNLLKKNFAVTKDDNTAAAFDVCFEFPREELPKRFETYDVILTVGRESERVHRLGLGSKFLYKGSYRVGVWAKEKENINGEGICSRSIQKIKLLLKELETSPTGSLSFIRTVSIRDDDRPGNPTIYHRIVTVETWHFSQEEK
jgi:hypothetical protein